MLRLDKGDGRVFSSPGFLDMYPQLNRVRLKISALTNFDMGDNILKVPICPRLGFCINCH